MKKPTYDATVPSQYAEVALSQGREDAGPQYARVAAADSDGLGHAPSPRRPTRGGDAFYPGAPAPWSRSIRPGRESAVERIQRDQIASASRAGADPPQIHREGLVRASVAGRLLEVASVGLAARRDLQTLEALGVDQLHPVADLIQEPVLVESSVALELLHVRAVGNAPTGDIEALAAVVGHQLEEAREGRLDRVAEDARPMSPHGVDSERDETGRACREPPAGNRGRP